MAKGLRRVFRIKLAPLPKAGGDSRCLMSLVDRTVEVQSERTFRGEMLRDSLTGLPNRLAFTEQLERCGEDSRRESNMRCWSSTCCVLPDQREHGQPCRRRAADHLCPAADVALRGGDMLARTGGNEFGVLVSLRRGAEDALTAAARIQEAMSAPFQIWDLEIRVDCAIGVALMPPSRTPRNCSATPSSR